MGNRSADWKRVIARERQIADEIKKLEADIAAKKRKLVDLETARRVLCELPDLPDDDAADAGNGYVSPDVGYTSPSTT